MKVLLFIPPGGYFAERWSKGSLMPPLGLLYIAAVLEREGVDVEVVPAEVLRLSWRDVERIIEEKKPDIVGVTTTTENRFQSFELLKRSKKVRPEAWTVLGGPHASMAAEDALAHIPEIDIVVRGEGELTMAELVKALSEGRDRRVLRNVLGISFRDEDGNVVTNPPRPFIKNLDELPFPARHLVPYERYRFEMDIPGMGRVRAVNLMTSRGCPFNCNFCATPVNWGRRVRAHSPERVLAEIEDAMDKYGIRAVWFYDDTFNANPARLEKICDMIIERKLGIKWYAEIRVDVMTKELFAKMVEAGLFYVSFGVEAGSERVRKEIIRKNVDLDQVRRIISWSREFGVIPNPFFIFSHPTETWEEAQETIKLIEEFKDDADISVSILHIYPGTDLERTAKQLGVLPEDFTWTKKRDRRIITLPAAQGEVPLFKHLLTWAQISELIFRWNVAQRKVSVWRKALQALKNIRSIDDLWRYFIMFLVYLKVKILKALGKL